MRQMKYLSPTSISLYLESPKDFYMAYLADHRPDRPPQTEPMAVGSAFDAFVKSYLHEKVVGNKDPRFDKMSLFESQVEPQNRDAAYKAGEYCFENYKKSGCLADLMLELQQSVIEPKFELDIMGQVEGRREGKSKHVGPVPFLGKPDVFFINKHGARVIIDWKVNGYYSKYNTSPTSGYVRMRDFQQNYGKHRDCFPHLWKGITINIGTHLEAIKPDWARQLSIYSWLCGEDVGTEDCIAGIDQLVCNQDTVRPGQPKIRIAEHRLRIGKEFQHSVFEKAQELWGLVNSDHFFVDMTKEDSQNRCKYLDNLIVEEQKPVSGNDEWLERMLKR